MSVLILRPAPVSKRTWLISQAPRLEVTSSRESESAGEWVESRLDYSATNRLFDRLRTLELSGSTLDASLRYGETPMWQFLPSFIWPEIHRRHAIHQLVLDVLRMKEPSRLQLVVPTGPEADRWRDVVTSVAGTLGVDVEISRERQTSRPFGVRPDPALRIMRQAKRATFRAVLRHLVAITPDAAAGVRTILFTSFPRHWVADPFDDARKYDEQLYPLLDAFRARGWQDFIGVDLPYDTDRRSIRAFRERIRDITSGLRWTSFEANADKSTRADVTRAREAFLTRWEQLHRRLNAARLETHGVDFLPSIKPTLRSAVMELVPQAVGMLRTADIILNEQRPDAVLATYETGPYERALIIRAGHRSIPTVGLQHGMIFPNHYDYMHRSVTTDSRATEGFVVPKITCVWGPIWKHNLTQHGRYPEHAVAVTGNWRYDRHVAKGTGLSVPNADGNLLILTAAQESALFVHDLLEELGNIVDLRRIRVKPHPAEDDRPIQDVLISRGLSPSALLQGALVPALNDAAVVIAQPSTSIAEAVLLGRNVIFIDRTDDAAFEPYSAATIRIGSVAEVGPVLQRLLNDPAERERLLLNREAFISNFFHQLDGRSANRVVETVVQLCSANVSSLDERR